MLHLSKASTWRGHGEFLAPSLGHKRRGRRAEKRFFVILHELHIIGIPKSSAGVGVLSAAADLRKFVTIFMVMCISLEVAPPQEAQVTCPSSEDNVLLFITQHIHVIYINIQWTHALALIGADYGSSAPKMFWMKFWQRPEIESIFNLQTLFNVGWFLALILVSTLFPLQTSSNLHLGPGAKLAPPLALGSNRSSFLPLILCASASSALVWQKRTARPDPWPWLVHTAVICVSPSHAKPHLLKEMCLKRGYSRSRFI